MDRLHFVFHVRYFFMLALWGSKKVCFWFCSDTIKTAQLHCCWQRVYCEFFVFLLSDLVTVLPQSNATVQGLIRSTGRGHTTSPTTGLSTTDTNVTWTMSTGIDVTEDPNPSKSTITAAQRLTHTSVTSPPASYTDLYHSNNTSDLEINPTHSLNTSTFSDQSVTSNLSTTLSYNSKVLRSTQEIRNQSMGTIVENSDSPGATQTLTTGTENKGNNYLLLLLLSVHRISYAFPVYIWDPNDPLSLLFAWYWLFIVMLSDCFEHIICSADCQLWLALFVSVEVRRAAAVPESKQ